MSKGIIVVDDVPKNCEDCLCCHTDNYNFYCKKNGKHVDWEGKPNWCPIKEMPVKLEEIKCPHSMSDYQQKGFSRGYKACLDKIEGAD